MDGIRVLAGSGRVLAGSGGVGSFKVWLWGQHGRQERQGKESVVKGGSR